MNPNFLNRFIEKLTRERVVPTISASVSWLIFGTTASGTRRELVGTGRFELPTPRTPSECSTRLSHVPTGKNRPRSASGGGVNSRDFTLAAAVLALRRGLFLKHSKLEFLFHGINPIQQHADFLSHAVDLAAALADNLARILVIGVAIVGE
jgi:hypothetical protein